MKKVLCLGLILILTCMSSVVMARDYVYYFLTSCGYEVTHVSPVELTEQQIIALSDSFDNIYCGGGALNPNPNPEKDPNIGGN